MRHSNLTMLALATMVMLTLTSYAFSPLNIPKVYAASPNFALSTSITEVDIIQGNSLASTVTITSLYNYTGTISLTASQPAGFTTSFNPTSLSPPKNGAANSTFNITVAASTTPGLYPVGITASDGTGLVHTATVSVQVVAPTFTVYATRASISLTQGKTGSATISISSNGFSGKVNLNAQILPTGPTVSLAQPNVTLTSGMIQNLTLTVSASPTTSSGNYTITISGSGTGPNGPLTSSTAIPVTVNPGPGASPLFSPEIIIGVTVMVLIIIVIAVYARQRPPTM